MPNRDHTSNESEEWSLGETAAFVGLTAAVTAAGAYMYFNYKTATPTQYLVKIGPFIKGVHMSKKTMRWPMQQITPVNIAPTTVEFSLKTSSSEYIEYHLPITVTFSPANPESDPEAFKLYATQMSDFTAKEVITIVDNIVHGEVRVNTANMTVKELFSDKGKFRSLVVEKVADEFKRFGVVIHNINVAEMFDVEPNTYFYDLRQRELSKAKADSVIAMALNDAESRKKKAEYQSDALKTENIQAGIQVEYAKKLSLEQIEAKKQVQLETLAMEKQIALYKQAADLETQRAEELVKMNVAQEVFISKSQGEATAEIRKAEGDATAKIRKAEGDANSIKLIAEAKLYSDTKAAEAVQLMLEAQAKGFQAYMTACRDNPDLGQFYLGLKQGLYDSNGLMAHISSETAKAVNHVAKDVHIWNTNNGSNPDGSTSSPVSNVIQDLIKSMPNLLEVITNQTNIKPPVWMPHISKTPKIPPPFEQ
jgi:flotillin